MASMEEPPVLDNISLSDLPCSVHGWKNTTSIEMRSRFPFVLDAGLGHLAARIPCFSPSTLSHGRLSLGHGVLGFFVHAPSRLLGFSDANPESASYAYSLSDLCRTVVFYGPVQTTSHTLRRVFLQVLSWVYETINPDGGQPINAGVPA